MSAKKIIRRTIGWWKSQQIRYANIAVEPAVLLLGSARSGTTWLAELINYQNTYRYIFEPFNRDEVKLCRDFAERQYLETRSTATIFHDRLQTILRGQFRNPWTDFYNKNPDNRKRLIKAVRAHFMLSYLRQHFSELPIILLLRHPFAVAYSRMQLTWPAPLEVLWAQTDLYKDYLQKYDQLYYNLGSPFERQVFFWGLENKFALAAIEQQPQHCLVFYENLVAHPRRSLQKVFDFLQLEYVTGIEEKFRRPSQSVQTQKATIPRQRWQDQIPAVQIDSALYLLEQLELTQWYDARERPVLR